MGSGRVVGLLVLVAAFALACAQLLGDVQVEQPLRTECETTALAGGLSLADCGLRPADAEAPAPPRICEEPQIRCEGRQMQQCALGGTAWFTLQTCATPALCRASDLSGVAECKSPTCGVEQMSCDDKVLRHCNADRTGWEEFDTCESAAHCDAGRRQCLPAPCDPGDRRCNLGRLERCNDEQTSWEGLHECATNELCEATLQGTAPGLVTGGVADGPPVSLEPARDEEGVIRCLEPICFPKGVKCDGAQLKVCVEGLTGFELAEPCATPALCQASITYTGLRGSPRCVRPACDPNEHRCVGKNLEVCNENRDGFRQIEECSGPSFCNASAADRNEPGCEAAPCKPGEERCAGPQIQRCRADREDFDVLGPPCDSRELCIDDDPLNAFCRPPVCQRGPESDTEFRCLGTTLQRCNEQHTGYDTLDTCDTPALCDPGLGFQGCQVPVCDPNAARCDGDVLHVCNADRTAFQPVERCAPGTCDSVAGRCADPCIVGSARCTSQGELEECRDRLIGRQVTARCLSEQLCDAGTRSCRQPLPGCSADGVRQCVRSGTNTLLQVCTAGRSRFDTLDTCVPGAFCDVNNGTCDVCDQNGQAACAGTSLVRCAPDGQSQSPTLCPQGCQEVATGPDRCFNCVRGAATCGGTQLSVCVARGATDESIQLQACGTAQRCSEELASCTAGTGCQCEFCDSDDTGCDGRFPTRCNAAHTAFERVLGSNGVAKDCLAATNCNANTGDCFPCAVFDVSCRAGVLQGCRLDRSGFDPIVGATPDSIRCSSDNGGQFSQRCSGSELQEERCTAPEALCNPNAGGCVECLPGPSFVSACGITSGGQAGHTQCQDGHPTLTSCADPVNSPCQEASCTGAGQCVFRSRAQGASCSRAGGAGVCDGLQRDPQCVECVDDAPCDDGNTCTADSCGVNGSCAHVAVAGSCIRSAGGPGVCSAGSCVECTSDANCNDNVECTADSCSGGGTCAHTPSTGNSCSLGSGAAGVCAAGRCQLCVPNSARCDNSNTLFRCNSTGTAEAPEACGGGSGACVSGTTCSPEGAGSCVPGAPLTGPCQQDGQNGTCQSGSCVVQPCGNGQLDVTLGEPCDGNLGVGALCDPGQSGSVTCNDDCTHNRSGCHATTCADLSPCSDGQVCIDPNVGCAPPPG